MKEQLISFETAWLAKQRGFNLNVHSCYGTKSTILYSRTTHGNSDDKGNIHISAPSQSLLQKWLREKHGIEVNAIPTGLRESKRYIPRFWFCGFEYNESDFETYEEALEMGLQEGLKLIE